MWNINNWEVPFFSHLTFSSVKRFVNICLITFYMFSTLCSSPSKSQNLPNSSWPENDFFFLFWSQLWLSNLFVVSAQLFCEEKKLSCSLVLLSGVDMEAVCQQLKTLWKTSKKESVSKLDCCWKISFVCRLLLWKQFLTLRVTSTS